MEERREKMKYVYPTLELSIYKKGIKLARMAESLEISTKALSNKLRGITSFTWPEACIIQKVFFPEMTKDELFEQIHKENGKQTA